MQLSVIRQFFYIVCTSLIHDAERNMREAARHKERKNAGKYGFGALLSKIRIVRTDRDETGIHQEDDEGKHRPS
jgi:hypothetical protein